MTNPKTFKFPTSAAVWAFQRVCDKTGVTAGYASLDGDNAVQVAGHLEASLLAAAHGGSECPVCGDPLRADESDQEPSGAWYNDI